MRLVQVMVPTGKREAVVKTLDDEGIDYVLSDETSGREYTAVVSFPLPTGAVEPVLEELREAGVERDAYTVVLDAETVVSDRFDALQERYAAENGDEDRIAREELASQADEMTPDRTNFLVLTVISVVVATAGLLLDSPAVVVGSMVIAPLLGPAIATSVGTVVDDGDLFRRGVRLQFLGGSVAVVAAAAFGALLRFGGVAPFAPSEVFAVGEVAERLSAGVLAVPVALGAGVAGALSLSAGVSAALVGVMIAAALVPPTAVVGIGIAWGRPRAVAGSAVLVVLNFLAINFTAVVTLWARGYRPDGLFVAEAGRTTRRRLAVLGVAVLLVSTVLGVATLAAADQRAVADAAREDARELLADAPGRLVAVAVESDGGLVARPTRVTVTVAVPSDTPLPRIAEPLAARLADETRATLPLPPSFRADRPLRVSVQFHTVETARAG
ncbi:MAG: TIGR00341 family protein [Halobaculum sp.]